MPFTHHLRIPLGSGSDSEGGSNDWQILCVPFPLLLAPRLTLLAILDSPNGTDFNLKAILPWADTWFCFKYLLLTGSTHHWSQFLHMCSFVWLWVYIFLGSTWPFGMWLYAGTGAGSLCSVLLSALAEEGMGEELEETKSSGITALLRKHIRHPARHWKQQEGIGMWELHKSALPLNESRYQLPNWM